MTSLREQVELGLERLIDELPESPWIPVIIARLDALDEEDEDLEDDERELDPDVEMDMRPIMGSVSPWYGIPSYDQCRCCGHREFAGYIT